MLGGLEIRGSAFARPGAKAATDPYLKARFRGTAGEIHIFKPGGRGRGGGEGGPADPSPTLIPSGSLTIARLHIPDTLKFIDGLIRFLRAEIKV